MDGEFRGVSCVTSLHQSVAHLRERGKPCGEESKTKLPQRFLVAGHQSSSQVWWQGEKFRQQRTSSISNEIKVTIILVVSCLNKHNLVTSNTHERFLLPWFSDFHKLQSASAFTPIAVTHCVEPILLFVSTPFLLREVNENSENEMWSPQPSSSSSSSSSLSASLECAQFWGLTNTTVVMK